MCWHVLARTGTYQHVPAHTGTYRHVPAHTGTYHHVPAPTVTLRHEANGFTYYRTTLRLEANGSPKKKIAKLKSARATSA